MAKKKKRKKTPGKQYKSKRRRGRRRSGQSTLLWGGIALVAVILIGVLVSQQDSTSLSTSLEISVTQAAEKRDQGAFILDVRTVEEWEEGHIPGSTLIPINELPYRLSEVPKGVEIVVVCQAIDRSQAGRDFLLSAGYEQVSCMRGGIPEWEAHGYPVEKGS